MDNLVAYASGADAWLAAVLIAPFIGSFLGVLIVRLPRSGDVLLSRSRCERCGHALAPRDLVPLISFALSRGRCRYCGGAISLFHPGVELAALGVAVWATSAMTGGDIWLSCVLGWTLLALSWIDIETMLLPDSLTLPLLVAGLGAATWLNPDELPDRLIAAVLGYLLLFATARIYRSLRHRDGLGMGDAKLLAALGAWLGLAALPGVLLLAASIGLIAAAGLAVAGRRVVATTALPFGPCLALSGWVFWLYGEQISDWLANRWFGPM